MAVSSVVEAIAATKVVMDAYDISTIINNINTLYSNALNQIIALTIGLLTLGGIILPLVIAYFQRQKSSADQIALTKTVSSEVNEAKKLLIEELDNKLAAKIEKYEERISDIKQELTETIEKIAAQSEAKIHHTQARSIIKDKFYADAVYDCETAIRNYSFAGDERNMQVIVRSLLLESILPNLNQTDFAKHDELEENFNSMLEVLNKLNVNERYAIDIKSFEAALKEAKVRQPTGD